MKVKKKTACRVRDCSGYPTPRHRRGRSMSGKPDRVPHVRERERPKNNTHGNKNDQRYGKMCLQETFTNKVFCNLNGIGRCAFS